MINRIEEIKKKGFNMRLTDDNMPTNYAGVSTDFSKIRVGIKTLDDATINVGELKRVNPKYGDKTYVLQAINRGDLKAMREISNFFYKTSGIYSRLCRYMAYLYNYDWLITPYINGGLGILQDSKELPKAQRDKIVNNFFSCLKYTDDFCPKKFFGDAALKVIRNGCYYGYILDNDKLSVQELPIGYCRSRYNVAGRPAVEFNMKFFDDQYSDATLRTRILKLFPEDFNKGYKAYKQGKLVAEFNGDTSGWYLLDPTKTIKFSLNGENFPPFISVIPAIIDLDEAQDLDRKRMAQKLLKIIIQKMPLDKNGDLIFDVDEAQELHNNAVKMLSRAIGLDVLTTFADVDVADMSDKSNTTQTDDLTRVERSVYNEAGVSQLQFNSDGNTALQNSILNDEASVYNLLLQFEDFLNLIIEPYNKSPKKYYFKAQILKTTIYNYKEMAKLYKEQTQMGYSKMLPQIALGQSQSSILANAYWENNILNLVTVFIPPLTSHVMNGDTISKIAGGGSSSNQSGSDGNVGRPEKEDNEKSDKTLANRESM